MRQSDVMEWVYDQCVTVLDTTSLLSLSNPATHVDEASDRENHDQPFVGIQKISAIPQSAGIGTEALYVDAINYDANGNLDSITYGKDVVLRLEVNPVIDEDTKLRDDLAEELADHFEVQVRRGELHSDMETVEVGEATPQDRVSDFVRADGVPLEIEYSRYLSDDVTEADTVNLGIDVAEDTDELDSWGTEDWGDDTWDSADAYDEVFN